MASKDVTIGLFLFGKRVQHGHIHVAGKKLDAAGSAYSRAAGVVVDEQVGFVGCIEDHGLPRTGAVASEA